MTGALSYYIIAIACLAVLAVVMFGLFTFARGGELNRKWSNKIMRLRVLLQLFAVILIALFAYMGGK